MPRKLTTETISAPQNAGTKPATSKPLTNVDTSQKRKPFTKREGAERQDIDRQGEKNENGPDDEIDKAEDDRHNKGCIEARHLDAWHIVRCDEESEGGKEPFNDDFHPVRDRKRRPFPLLILDL